MLVILLILILGLAAMQSVRNHRPVVVDDATDAGIVNPEQNIDGVPSDGEPGPTQAVLEGKPMCLAHRDASGPQTMECALGITLVSGESYALDLSAVTFESGFDLMSFERVRVSGILVPVEAISADMWQKYDIKGIVSVQSAVAL